eukprot:TRINITY_DN6824_c0_g1_i5.p1 TRINITY_DN6824_c0_g1~~TRINITY_DN6824_c0_g1_i5.p1  ORF type:complete len:564 (+),score=113.48 TRINITY_DN6824_c0_g1_i5:1248-2939(+)
MSPLPSSICCRYDSSLSCGTLHPHPFILAKPVSTKSARSPTDDGSNGSTTKPLLRAREAAAPAVAPPGSPSSASSGRRRFIVGGTATRTRTQAQGRCWLGLPVSQRCGLAGLILAPHTRTHTRMQTVVNVCWSALVGDATAHTNAAEAPVVLPHTGKSTGVREGDGLWAVPYCLSAPRLDQLPNGGSCFVFDFAVGEGTFARAEESESFRRLLLHTAVDSISELHRHTITKKFRMLDQPAFRERIELSDEIIAAQMAAEAERTAGGGSGGSNAEKPPLVAELPAGPSAESEGLVAKPAYEVAHRFRTDARVGEVPADVVVTVRMPKAGRQRTGRDISIQLGPDRRTLHVRGGTLYLLDVRLRHSVVPGAKVTARFDTDTRVLSVELPVLERAVTQAVARRQPSSGAPPAALGAGERLGEAAGDPLGAGSAAGSAGAVQAVAQRDELPFSEVWVRQSKRAAPPYAFRQSLGAVTLLFPLAGIEPGSLAVDCATPRDLSVRFALADGSTVCELGLQLAHDISPEATRWSVQAQNAVVVLQKATAARWASLLRSPAGDAEQTQPEC